MRAPLADIFLSYDRADRARARVFADTLAAHGWTVWWDANISAGMRFDEIIDREISAARCLIVLWSAHSIASSWVKEEALEGLRRNILVPVLMDSVTIPLGFRRIHAADFMGWDANSNDARFASLSSDIATRLASPSVSVSVRETIAASAASEAAPQSQAVAAATPTSQPDQDPHPDPATGAPATPCPEDPALISVPKGSYASVFQLPQQGSIPLALEGFWEARVTYQSTPMTFPRDVPANEVFEFEIDGPQLHGAASFCGLMRGLFDGKLNGSRLSFLTKGRDSGNRQVEISYRGTYSGDEIAFVLVVNADTWAPAPIRFVATRGAINQKLAE